VGVADAAVLVQAEPAAARRAGGGGSCVSALI